MTTPGVEQRPEDPRARLAELERIAADLLTVGRPAWLAGELDELLELDFDDAPLARLLVGAVCHDVRRGDPRARELVDAASEELLRRRDTEALGVAANVRANLALSRGEIDEAVICWRESLDLLDDGVPLTVAALAHLSLEAYRVGDLKAARRRAEEALGRVRLRADRSYEIVPLIYLSVYAFAEGELFRVERILDAVDELYLEIRERDVRNEAPLLKCFRGVLHAVRDERVLAEAAFDDALRLAAEVETPWYAVMARCLRAEFTAGWDAARSVDDALMARRQAQELADDWWYALAGLAEGVACREIGAHERAQELLEEAVERLVNPFERGRALLALGETHLSRGDTVSARSPLDRARREFETLGTGYWLARTLVRLGEADPEGGARHFAAARGLDDGDPAYRTLLSLAPRLRIELHGSGSIEVGGEQVRFLTRHAELAVYLLATADARGVSADALGSRLWPDAPVSRLRPRLRTLLWQVRTALGAEAWRLQRRGQIVHLDLTGASVDHGPHRLDMR